MDRQENEKKLDYFADMIEAAAEICDDSAITQMLKTGKTRLKGVSEAVRKHKQASIKILAAAEETDVDSYIVPGPIVMIGKLVKIFSSPEMTELFIGQSQETDAAASGSATANTGDGAV